MERMKKMRKILGLGRKKKKKKARQEEEEEEEEGAPPPPPLPPPPPPEPQSRMGAASSAGAYRVRSRELGPLHRAAAEGDLGRLRQLLTQKQDPDQRDRGGRTPLHLACANGCTEIVALLVDHRCQLNIYDGDRRSPLMKAVQCQQELCAIYLLEHGADPNFVDVHNNTALHFAALNSSTSIAKHLLDHNAHIEAQNTDGSTPLIVAVVENNREMVEFLLKKGASVHATDKAGRTPLLIATSNKKRDLTHVLLSYGSDVSHKDDSGWSAQDYAMLSDDPILLQYIAEYSKQKNGSGKSSDDPNVFSVLNVPDRTGDAGITLGAPATNIEDSEVHRSLGQAAGGSGKVLEDHSSGDSVRDSGKTDDTWPSSEEEELDFSAKKPQKPSLARLMSVSQQFKKNDEKSSIFRSEHVVDSQRNSSVSDAGGVNESFSRPLFHVQSFPQPAHSSPGSFSTRSQMASRLSPKQEENFSEENEEENRQESPVKIENGAEEAFKEADERESFAGHECEEKGDLGSRREEMCGVEKEETQETGDGPVSFVAGRYGCPDENAAVSKANKEPSGQSLGKGDSYGQADGSESSRGLIDPESRDRMAQEGFHRKAVSSVEIFGTTALAEAGLPCAESSHPNQRGPADLGAVVENGDCPHPGAEGEERRIAEQNSEGPDWVDDPKSIEQQDSALKEPEEATSEPPREKSEKEEEEPKAFQLDTSEGSFEEEEEEDEEEEEEEDGKNPGFVAKNLNCHAISLNQVSPQDDSVKKAPLRLGADEEEDEEKAPESPWDSEGVSESPRKPAVDSSPASPAKMKTLMPAVAEEPCDRSSANAKPEMAKMNLEHEAASSPLSQQDQTRGKQKSDLMEELGLDDADDIEDASDWDSASVSQGLPCANTFNVFTWGERSNPAQLATSNASPRTSIPARVDETPVAETREAAKGPSCSEQNAEEFEHGEAKGKSVITAPSSREKLPPGKQSGEHLCLYNGKKTGAEIDKAEAEDEGRPVDATFWEERYEKLWVAKEKREVKSNFKSITAELKLKFGEIDVNETKSRSFTEGPSRDVFSCGVEGVEESPPSHPSETTIRVRRKGETGPLKPVVAGKDPNVRPQDSKLLCPPSENQSVEANQERSNDLSPDGKGFTQPGTDEGGDHLQKRPGDSPVDPDQERVADTVFRTFLKQRKTDSASETLSYFNAGVHTGQCLGPELGNRGEPPDKDPRKERDEALERDVARFKNEVGMLRRAFLALEKEKARLQKEVEEEKRKQELAETKKVENTEKAAAHIKEKTEQRPSADENQPLATGDEMKSAVAEENQGTDVVSSSDGEELVPVPHKGNNPTARAKGRRKREKKRRISKPKVGQQTVEERHRSQDESSLSEASLEEEKQPEKMVNRSNKICKAMNMTNDCEDLTPSSDTATEDIESPTSVYGEAMMLIEQLTLDSKDSVSLFKIQNIFHGYERVIEREKGRSTQLLGKVKKLENEKKDQQRILDETREAKCMLDHQTVEQESDISGLKFSLKQEEEKRTSAEMQYEKTQEQLRKKEEQCCKQMEEKQQLEIMLRGLEVELRTLKNRLAQVEEERDKTQRQLSQEQKARALQEGVLNTHLWRQKEWEEESKKAAAKHSEMSNHHDQEEELMQQNQAFQEELAVLRAELDRLRTHHEEKDSKYLEENEALKEKIEDLKKELKLNEEALTQTVFQYNGQINVSKTEAAVLASKLEHTKENKERLKLELDSFRARMGAAVQELERCQASGKDLERTLQRERDEWLHSKDRLSREVGSLQEANGSLSQQLGRAESKVNSLENELQLATHGLREKSLLFEGVQRDLNQAQGRVKELEHAWQLEKEQVNKQAIKQDSLQERLAQLQSENLLLRQQLEDVHNKGILKEKVVTDVQEKFSDIFGKLQADTEKQLRMVEERNQELVAKCHDFREQVLKYEAEKADREGTVRQLQQELADSLKKQSMSEASLEVSTRYRSDLEEDKQQLQKEIDRIKSKQQESEEQYLQSERRIHDLRNALDSKEREASVTSQKLHDLLAASSGANNAIKQLEGHIQRLEVENARLEATTTQQSHRIEILQKDLQDSLSVHSRLEELITGLQTAKINLEEELHQQAQKQTTLSVMAQDTHCLWEEELKSRSKLGVRLSELDREKAELMAQCENERKKVKKLAELKHSVELRLDQEMKRNNELQKEYNGIKKLAKATKRKLKEYESVESSRRDIETKYSETDVEIGKLRKKLEAESTRCARLESANDELRRELSSMKALRQNYEELQKSKQRLEEEMASLQAPGPGRPFDLSQVEQYRRDVEERAKQEVIQKLEEVNLFLQTQAASQDTLEQIRATNQASLRSQLEKRIQDLESELSQLKRSQQEGRLQKELAQSELERCKSLYSEELKTRKALGRKLDRAQEKLAEANAKLFHERHRSKSLLANSFLSGSLSAGPVLETVPLGNLGGGSLAFGRPLSLGAGFVSPAGSPLASKSRVEAYLAKMQMELETTINKELDQAKAELDAASARVSPIGSLDGSSKNLNLEPDQVAKAAEEYLDVLKKNYMI